MKKDERKVKEEKPCPISHKELNFTVNSVQFKEDILLIIIIIIIYKQIQPTYIKLCTCTGIGVPIRNLYIHAIFRCE